MTNWLSSNPFGSHREGGSTIGLGRRRASTQRFLDERGLSSNPFLSPSEVEQLPVGTIVWSIQDGRRARALVVNEGRVLLPISVLPERATGYFPPDGDPAAAFGDTFLVMKEGSGKLPTHPTAVRWASKT